MEAQTHAPEPSAAATPFFTVGLTTYQRPTLLVKAIQSLLSQDFTDYEVIIVDGASMDNTEAVAKGFISPTVSYIRQTTNQGIGAARNEVIKQARGEFIVFLDDDDCLAPDFLYQVHQALQNIAANVGFATTARRTYQASESGDIFLYETTYGHTSTVVMSGSAYTHNPIGGGSGLIVRTVAARAMEGFSTDSRVAEDIDFMLQLSIAWDFAIIPQAKLIIYALQVQQITQDRATVGVCLENLGDKESLHNFQRTRLRFYRMSARMFYAAKLRGGGRRVLRKALKVAPFSYKTWGLFLLLELNSVLPLHLRRRLLSHPRHGYQPT